MIGNEMQKIENMMRSAKSKADNVEKLRLGPKLPPVARKYLSGESKFSALKLWAQESKDDRKKKEA